MPVVVDDVLHVSMRPFGRSVTSTSSGLATRRPQQVHGERWQAVIDQLFKWWNDPGYFAGEDYDPPTSKVLELAMDLATSFRVAGYPPPDRVVPDANEGIVFQLRCGEQTEKIHVWGDGEVEYIRFSGTKIIDRRPIQLDFIETHLIQYPRQRFGQLLALSKLLRPIPGRSKHARKRTL